MLSLRILRYSILCSYSIVRSCWADDPKLRPSFKYLAGQFEQLLGRTAKYIDMEQNSISNPVYCENSDGKCLTLVTL